MASIYTAALMEHNAHPDYKYQMDEPTCTHDGVNPSCGDEIRLKLKTDGQTITDGAFVGSGCAVSQASADIMLGMVIGRPQDEALRLCELFQKMIRGEASEDEIDQLEEAGALRDVAHMPARVKCAMLGWRTLNEALRSKHDKPNS